jgi:hypothetical protein
MKEEHHMKGKLIVLAVAATFPLAALAQQPPTSPSRTPESQSPPGSQTPKNPSATKEFGKSSPSSGSMQLDRNNDGYVSREEAKTSSEVSRKFNDLDKDGDGKLSTKELGSKAKSGSSSGGMSKEPKTKY